MAWLYGQLVTAVALNAAFAAKFDAGAVSSYGATLVLAADAATARGLLSLPAGLLNSANGTPALDGTGKIPLSLLPTTIAGALNYQGAWNANTNSPALASGVGTKGYYYVVSVAGATSLDGIAVWNVGDWAIYNGTAWNKLDGLTSEVISVAGRTGVVTLAVADVSGAAALASPTFTGTPAAPTAAPGTNTTQLATTAFVFANAVSAASPAFTGNPTAPTPSPGDNDTSLATTAFVHTEIANISLAETWTTALTGSVVKAAYSENTTSTACATMPAATTNPVSTDGTLVASISHTALASTDKIRLIASLTSIQSTAGNAIEGTIAIFKDTTLVGAWNVLGASGNGYPVVNTVAVEITAGDTSAHTYSFRAGHTSGMNAMTFNTSASGPPAQRSSLSIIEIKA